MGNELQSAVRIGRTRHEGKVLLETSEPVFRGATHRAKILFSEIKSAEVVDGELRVKTKDGETVFEIGRTAAEKWREKILHPKTRIEKLAVKLGTRVQLVGPAEPAFVKELKCAGAKMTNGKTAAPAELIFMSVETKNGLSDVAKIARNMEGAAVLWMVYPKAKREITEGDVIGAGRKAGLKDVKVVGFSTTHTALKFVIPVAKR